MAVSQYSALINNAAAKYGVDPSLVASVIQSESAGNPYAVSSKGAVGLMQVLPSTAGMTSAQLMDPATNIDAGTVYLAQMINQFGSVDTALAAYNWGPGNVATGATWPSSVTNYVDTILGRIGSVFTPSTDGSQPLVDLSGSAAATDTASIMSQLDLSNIDLSSSPGTAIAVVLGVAAIAFLISR